MTDDKDPLPPMTATEDDVKPTKRAYQQDFAGDAKREASGIFKEGMQHPSTKPVLKGAAIGAVAGILLPILTLPVGLAAGAGYAFYKRLRP